MRVRMITRNDPISTQFETPSMRRKLRISLQTAEDA